MCKTWVRKVGPGSKRERVRGFTHKGKQGEKLAKAIP